MIVKRARLRRASADNYHTAYMTHPLGKIALVPKRQEGRAQQRRRDGGEVRRKAARAGRRNGSGIAVS